MRAHLISHTHELLTLVAFVLLQTGGGLGSRTIRQPKNSLDSDQVEINAHDQALEVGGEQSLHNAPPVQNAQSTMMEDDMPAAPPAAVPGTFKIMTRKKVDFDDKSSKTGDDEDSAKNNFSKMALSEREQAYQEARARIFGESANAEQARPAAAVVSKETYASKLQAKPAAAVVSEETYASKLARRDQQEMKDHSEKKRTKEDVKTVAPEAEREKQAKAKQAALEAGQERKALAALDAARERKALVARRARGTSHFQVGVFVVAVGLKKEASHLNGKACVIQSCDKDKGQCLVKFDKAQGEKLLQMENLDLPWSLG